MHICSYTKSDEIVNHLNQWVKITSKIREIEVRVPFGFGAIIHGSHNKPFSSGATAQFGFTPIGILTEG